MAFPPAATVPTTEDRLSVEIQDPSLDAVDPAAVDSGADIARRAQQTVAGVGQPTSEAELRGALSGDETAFAALETYYKDPQAAADRLSELGPAERRELAGGNLEVLGELKPDAATRPDALDERTVGSGLAAYSHSRAENAATYYTAEAREMDRATGREPGVDPSSPETDLERTREAGESPSRAGRGGGLGEFMANRSNAARSGGGSGETLTVEQSMERQAISMSASL